MRAVTPYCCLEVALADEELADEGFAVGQVEVGLDPHAADDLPAAFFDALAISSLICGILVGDPLGVVRGGLGVGVVGVLVHELERGGEGALDDVDGFGAGQSQAASMWELPVRSKVACARTGLRARARMCCGLRREASKADWSPASRALRSMAADGLLRLWGGGLARGLGSAGRRLAAVMHWMRMSSGLGRLGVAKFDLAWLTPAKVLSSTVWRSLTATRILSPGLAGSKRTMGSRSSPRATRRPLK